MNCSICLLEIYCGENNFCDNSLSIRLSCGEIFHKKCLMDWIEFSNKDKQSDYYGFQSYLTEKKFKCPKCLKKFLIEQ